MNENDVRTAARDLLRVAFLRLGEQHVIPRPSWDAYLRVGRDYWGPDLMSEPAFKNFEETLSSAYPRRFSSRLRVDVYQEFPNSFAFGLVEAAVARVTTGGKSFHITAPEVERSIEELIQALNEDTFEVACAWVMTHVTTATGRTESLGAISVTPGDGAAQIENHIASIIPGARALLGSDLPFVHDPPISVVELRGRGSHPYHELTSLRGELDTFILHLRLLFASTTRPCYEVNGSTSLQRSVQAFSSVFRRSDPLLRRIHRLTTGDLGVIDGFRQLMEEIARDEPDMAVTSLGMALRKFSTSYLGEPWFEEIVDLCTALEAALSGTDKEDVTLRLRFRAAALLATREDPPQAVFEDVGYLYGLRSTLVHGGNLQMQKMLGVVEKISTVDETVLPRIRVTQAVDRLRDLGRRSILARIALASGDDPLWPLSSAKSVLQTRRSVLVGARFGSMHYDKSALVAPSRRLAPRWTSLPPRTVRSNSRGDGAQRTRMPRLPRSVCAIGGCRSVAPYLLTPHVFDRVPDDKQTSRAQPSRRAGGRF